MATFRYLFCDLDGTVRAELPLSGVGFGWKLNDSGALDASLDASDPRVTIHQPHAVTTPGKTAVYVDRDGALVWGGILWRRSWDASRHAYRLSASEFGSYWDAALAPSQDHSVTPADQGSIVWDLLTGTAADGYDVDIALPTYPWVTGVTRSSVFHARERRTTKSILDDHARMEDGFEWAVRAFYSSGGRPSQEFRFGYPRLGRETGAVGTVFDSTNVETYTLDEDAKKQANVQIAAGAGAGDQAPTATAYGTSETQGWPKMTKVTSYGDVTTATILQAHADAAVVVSDEPPLAISLTTVPDSEPFVGYYDVGDDARFRMTDDRFPDGIDETYRIADLSVKMNESGSEQATVQLAVVV